MNTMQNVNCCEGCFYAGVTNGYKPECNCARATKYKETEKSVPTELIDDIDELLPDTNQHDTYQDDKKTRRMQRRIAAKKYAKNAPKTLAVVNAKYNRIPSTALLDSFDAAGKKIFNAEKNAAHIYRAPIIKLEFPEIPKETLFGNSIYSLLYRLSDWKTKDDSTTEMKIACETAIDYLNTASRYDAQVVGLHREGNILHLTLGFREKISMLDFLQKTA